MSGAARPARHPTGSGSRFEVRQQCSPGLPPSTFHDPMPQLPPRNACPASSLCASSRSATWRMSNPFSFRVSKVSDLSPCLRRPLADKRYGETPGTQSIRHVWSAGNAWQIHGAHSAALLEQIERWPPALLSKEGIQRLRRQRFRKQSRRLPASRFSSELEIAANHAGACRVSPIATGFLPCKAAR